MTYRHWRRLALVGALACACTTGIAAEFRHPDHYEFDASLDAQFRASGGSWPFALRFDYPGAGDATTVAWRIDVLDASGQVVATLANMLNPELIVLSGSIAQSNDILLAAAREAIYGASHPLVSRDLQIIRSQMGSSSGLVGAAIVAAEGIFSPPVLRDWIMAGRPQAHPQFQALKSKIEAQSSAIADVVKPPRA